MKMPLAVVLVSTEERSTRKETGVKHESGRNSRASGSASIANKDEDNHKQVCRTRSAVNYTSTNESVNVFDFDTRSLNLVFIEKMY